MKVLSKVSAAAKAVAAALAAGAAALAAAQADGYTTGELVTAALAVLGALGVTYAVPNKDEGEAP